MKDLSVKSKVFRYFTALFLLIILFAGQNISALMAGAEPKIMVENSDLIIVGTVIDKSLNGDYVNSKVSVDRILKGKTTKKYIDITTSAQTHVDVVTYGFPDKGTKVMLLLRNEHLFADFNNIAIVKSNKVKLFDGISFGYNGANWSQSLYEKEYDKLLQNNRLNYLLLSAAAVIVLLVIVILFIWARSSDE